MTKQVFLAFVAVWALAGCAKKPQEPTAEEIMAALPACKSDACKDFKKIHCGIAGDPDGMNDPNYFKCQFSYSAAGEMQTQEKCFIREGQLRLADPCF